MSDNTIPQSIRLVALSIFASACISWCSGPGLAQVQIDVVFLIDGSNSVDECLFEFEKEAVGRLVCGPDCASCSDVHVPLDGTIAISVIQFASNASGGAVEEIELTVVDSPATAQELCEQIRGHEAGDLNRRGGDTPLLAGLQKAREVLEESTTGATQRLLIIVTDVDAIIPGDMIMRPTAEAMRTLCGGPIRIAGFRFSDYDADDPTCDQPPESEILVELANTPDSPAFEPDQPIGMFACRELCPYGNCGTVPDSCTYDPEMDVGGFIDFARTVICPTGVNDVTITQQTQQDPPNPVSVGSTVTFTVAAETDSGYLFYQWQKSGTDMFGETAASLVLTDVQDCDAGAYACRVWTPCDEEGTGGGGGGG